MLLAGYTQCKFLEETKKIVFQIIKCNCWAGNMIDSVGKGTYLPGTKPDALNLIPGANIVKTESPKLSSSLKN